MNYQTRRLEEWEERHHMNQAMGNWLTAEEVKIQRVEWALDPPDEGHYSEPLSSHWDEEQLAAMRGEP
jgi:hypothetical protein